MHDVAATADYLAVRAVLRGERALAPDEGLTPDRYPALALGVHWLPAAAHNAAGPPSDQTEESTCLLSWSATHSSAARSPTST